MTRRPQFLLHEFLLHGALAHALDVIGALPPSALNQPTPCPRWDVDALVRHLVDSLGMLTGARRAHDPTAALEDPITGFIDAACLLLTRPLTGQPAEAVPSLMGALEVAVHTWDIIRACEHTRPVPSIIAVDLLELAPRIVPAHLRPRLFAAPVAVPAGAPPGDRLVALLGRQPRWTNR